MAANAKAKRAAITRWLVLCLLVACGWPVSGCGWGTSSQEQVAAQRQTLSAPTTVTLTVPNPLTPIAPVLAASNGMELGASDVITGAVTAMGSAGLTTQPGGVVVQGDAWSVGPVNLGDRTNLEGTLHASSVVLGNQVTVKARDSTPHIDPPSTLVWNVQYPPGTGANINLNSGQSQTLSPGLYGTINLNSQSTLTLSTGTYYLTGLSVNSQVTVNLNQVNGPVIIYVTGNLTLNGSFVPHGGTDGGTITPDLLIGYLGTNQVNLQSPFSGAIVAPFTTLTLNPITGTYVGFFYGQSINVQASTNVTYGLPIAVVTAANPSGPQCQQLLGSVIPPSELSHFCRRCLSPDDTDLDGVPDCADGCPYDPKKIAPGVCGCGIADVDSDGDGIPDCIDPCRFDPNNVNPGECGCLGEPDLRPAGTACVDTACPQSGATCNGAGVCGNRAACAPAQGCTFVNTFSTSYWLCGNPLPPVTGPDGGIENGGGGGQGAAPGQLTEQQAENACSAKGLTLTRISSMAQNRLITPLLTNPLWLGANDIASGGAWFWSAPGTNSGQQFWSGGPAPSGSSVNQLFSFWGPGAPGTQQCASMRPGDGRWFDTNCAETLGYVCQFQTPIFQPTNFGPPGAAGQPVQFGDGSCVPEFDESAGGLPATPQQLMDEIDAASQDVFVGAAANPPPPGSVCPSDQFFDAASQGIGLGPDSGAGCWFSQQTLLDGGTAPDGGLISEGCFQDTDCTGQLGPGWFCRQLKNFAACTPPDGGPGAPTELADGGGNACLGQSWCVQIQCPTVNTSCNEVQVCNPDASFDAGPDPTLNLDAGLYSSVSAFGGVVPDAAPSGSYIDPPDGATGPNHPWCWMVPQHPVANATQPEQDTNGSSGNKTAISFSFDPNLEFTANTNPIALGETGLNVHAGASFQASVALDNFLGQNYSADIVDIGAGIDAVRCSVNNDRTQFTVLGLDVLSLLGVGVPKFDSAELFPGPTQDCNNAVANFGLWANRVKKAFRDGQQLLSQYHGAQDAGFQLAPDLCQNIVGAIGASDIAFFPGGLNCPLGEPVETTINRFVDYFQAPGFGQISQLRNAALQLVNKSQAALNNVLPNLQTQFLDIKEDESQTILDVPFAIGPVPMLLQVDVFAGFGIAGNFDLVFTAPLAKIAGLDDTGNTFNPNDPNTTQTLIPLAHAGVEVMPYAYAGLSAFIGAGFDLGAISATLGIEGSVTLGDVAVPIFAGAGIDLMEQYDPRPLPADIASVSIPDTNISFNPVGALFQFQLPKAFQFFAYIDYGAGIELDNVLSGEIDARLHISFFFFSRTWRKTIVSFKGWSHHFDLISGSFDPSLSVVVPERAIPSAATNQSQATTEVSGSPSVGLGEMQMPLTVLEHLPVPDGGAPADAGDAGDAGDGGVNSSVPTVEFDASAVQGFFYDDLCCAKGGASCNPAGTPQCCPDYQCILQTDASNSGVCVIQCIEDGGACRPDASLATCCGSLSCNGDNVCAPPPPPPCNVAGNACGAGGCCSPFTCDPLTNLCCSGLGGACGPGGGGCCTDLECNSDNVCAERPPP